MEKKRMQFKENERELVKELVSKYATVVENKKSDLSSLIAKKTAWENITEEYNSPGLYCPRSAAQLKKCWENIKFRKKNEQLSMSKEKILIGRGGLYYEPGMLVHPEGDDVKLEYAPNSDTTTPSYPYILARETPVPTSHIHQLEEDFIEEDNSQADSLHLSEFAEPSPHFKIAPMKAELNRRLTEESLRLRKNILLLNHEMELHALRKRKLELEVDVVQLQKRKLELEIEKFQEG